jgi:hypothetical protein
MSNSRRDRAKRAGFAAAALWVAVAGATGFAQPLAAPQSQPQAGATVEQGADNSVESRMRQRRRQMTSGQGATTQPSTDVSRAADGPRVSEGEWEAASGAIKSHSPNVWERINRMPSDSPARIHMMRSLIDRHRDLQRIERRDPEQYKREFSQLELEDQILGVSRDIRRSAGEEEANALKPKLRELVGKLVDLRIANREARLKRLNETLTAERERLENDKRTRDDAVERHFGTALKGPGRPPRSGDGSPSRRREGPGERQVEGGPSNRPEGAPPPTPQIPE